MIEPRILIVEDERISALALANTLSRLGYAVSGTCSNGEAALKHIIESPPDLVLMDIRLEGAIDGIETAGRIPSDLMVPVIYLTSFADGELVQRARATKPYGYVVKPSADYELNAAIEVALERRETERALLESEQRLRFALDTAEATLWEVDLESEHILYRDHFGWKRASQHKPLADRFRDFLSSVFKEDQDKVKEAFDQVLDRDRSCEVEFRTIGADGQLHWYRLVAKARRANGDRRPRVIGVSRDVTRAKLATEELQASERNYQELISTIHGIIWEIDRGRRLLTYVSDSAERVLGYSAQEWLADPMFWEKHIHREDFGEATARHHHAMRTGQSYDSQYRMIAKDGRIVWIHEAVCALGGSGTTSILRGVMVDITDLKSVGAELQRSERELRRLLGDREEAMARAVAANQAKSNFLAMMSHELRTPLNAILGFSDLMRSEVKGPLGNPAYRGYVDDIHQAGSLLLGIINSILDLSRIESGKFDLNKKRLCLNDVWSRIGSTMRGQAVAKSIDLRFLNPSSPTWVYGDVAAVSQILINLIANAIKFTQSGGLVEVGEEPGDGSHGVIFVRDNGRGIPADKIDDVHKPFVQVSDSYARDVGGVGLGLAICKSLAEAMSGWLRISSQLGEGTKVQLFLPKHSGDAAVQEPG